MGSSGYSGQLLLQHSDSSDQYRAVFREMREAEELLDVTLACEDETIDVHKVVMSASSPFFRKILQKTKQKQPFIYLKGMKFQYLKVLIDFVYTGEASIAAEDLNILLEAANDLQITGLADSNDNEGVNSSPKETTKKDDKKSLQRNTTKKRELKQKDVVEVKYENEETFEEHLKTTSSLSYDSEEITFTIEEETKRELVKGNKEATSQEIESQSETNIDMKDVKIDIEEETLKEIEEEINKNLECGKTLDGEKNFKCKICSKDFKRKVKASNHVEIHLDKFTFSCEFCSKTMKSRSGLKSHIIYNHTKK